MYAIHFRHDLNLLDVRWTGLFTPQVALRFAHEVVDGYRRSGFQTGYRLRIDMSAILVHPHDGIMTLHETLRDFPRASRIAMVTRSAIGRQQIRRLMSQPYMRIFDDADAAFAWLIEPADALV